MSGKRWFVMVHNGRSDDDIPMPLVTDEEDVALFDSEADANRAAWANPFGEAYGFEVYEW